MAPITPLDGIAEILRKRVAGEATAKGKRPGSSTQTGATGAVTRLPIETLRRRLASSVAKINANEPGSGEQLTRLFVESVLAWQFGEELLSDPGFTELISEVQTTLESEPGFISALLKEIGRDIG